MIIYPAIDIKDGKCVRLRQGSFKEVTVYFENPLDAARKWKDAGAKYLHVVDLDGARSGSPKNLGIVSGIVKQLGLKVQLGGGIRTLQSIETVLGMGVSRVILGTAAVKDPELVEKAVERFGECIAVGIDARNGRVATDGWEDASGYSAIELAGQMERIGVKTVIYTDIEKDGMLEGPNFEAIRSMKEATGLEVIASGGVAGIHDIVRLKETGADGVIAGKALYTGALDLAEALEVVGKEG